MNTGQGQERKKDFLLFGKNCKVFAVLCLWKLQILWNPARKWRSGTGYKVFIGNQIDSEEQTEWKE